MQLFTDETNTEGSEKSDRMAQREESLATLTEHAGSATPTKSEPGTTPASVRHTVLVVDDEDSVRAVLAEVLDHSGFQVLAAADGAEALEVYTQNCDCIDLVVCDLMMPNMDGLELVKALRAQSLELKIVVVSGMTSFLTHPAKRAELEELGVATFLMKPFTARELLRTVQSELRRIV